MDISRSVVVVLLGDCIDSFFFLYSTTVQVQFSSKTWENKNILFHQTLSSKLIHKYIEIKIRNHSKNYQNNRRER